MNKRELVDLVCARLRTTKGAAEDIVEVVLAEIQSGVVRDREVTLVGFGSFVLRPRAPRVGRNPQTGAVMDIPAGWSVSFRPAKAWRERMGEKELERDAAG